MSGRNLAKPFAIAGFILAEIYMVFTVLGPYSREVRPPPMPIPEVETVPAGTPPPTAGRRSCGWPWVPFSSDRWAHSSAPDLDCWRAVCVVISGKALAHRPMQAAETRPRLPEQTEQFLHSPTRLRSPTTAASKLRRDLLPASALILQRRRRSAADRSGGAAASGEESFVGWAGGKSSVQITRHDRHFRLRHEHPDAGLERSTSAPSRLRVPSGKRT